MHIQKYMAMRQRILVITHPLQDDSTDITGKLGPYMGLYGLM